MNTDFQIVRDADGHVTINGKRIKRTEWFDEQLYLITVDGEEYVISGVSLDQFLSALQDGE